MKAEESILIERLKKGERTAFNELYGTVSYTHLTLPTNSLV